MTTGKAAYVIETDGSIHEIIFTGDSKWNEAEVGNILTDIFSKGDLPLLEDDI